MDKYLIKKKVVESIPSTSATNIEDDDSITVHYPENYLFAEDSYFSVQSRNEATKQIVGKCSLCHKIIQGQTTSTGNFIVHLMVSIVLHICKYCKVVNIYLIKKIIFSAFIL